MRLANKTEQVKNATLIAALGYFQINYYLKLLSITNSAN